MKRIDNLCQSNAFPGLVEVRPPRKPILLLIPRPCILRGIRWHAQPFLFGCTWNSLTCSAIFVRLHFKSESKWRMQFLCTWVDRTSGCLRWRAYSFSLNKYVNNPTPCKWRWSHWWTRNLIYKRTVEILFSMMFTLKIVLFQHIDYDLVLGFKWWEKCGVSYFKALMG